MLRSPVSDARWSYNAPAEFAWTPAPAGAEVLAPAVCVVDKVWTKPGYGTCVRLLYVDGARSVFTHLDDVCVREGQVVAEGARVGRVGASGEIGVGLAWRHYDARNQPQNPVDYLFRTTRGRMILGGIIALSLALGVMVAEDLRKAPTPRKQ